jgi:S-adenosylmethionine/arginine decarboxylase-like enzyme
MREVQKNGKECSAILHRKHEVMAIKNQKAAMYTPVGNTGVYLIYFKHVSVHH